MEDGGMHTVAARGPLPHWGQFARHTQRHDRVSLFPNPPKCSRELAEDTAAPAHKESGSAILFNRVSIL